MNYEEKVELVIEQSKKIGANIFVDGDDDGFSVVLWNKDKEISVTIMNGLDDEGNFCYYAEYDNRGSFCDNDEEYKVYKRLSGAINYAKKMLGLKDFTYHE